MRKFVFFLLFSVLFWTSGCSVHAWREYGEAAAAGAAAALPEVREGPFWSQLGIALKPKMIAVKNGVHLPVRVVVYGKEVGRLAPWDMVYGGHSFEPFEPQIPVIAMAYTDATYKECVDAAGHIYRIRRGNPSGEPWTVRLSDFSGGAIRNNLASDVLGEGPPVPRRVKTPREWWRSTVGVQVTNVTSNRAYIYLNDAELFLVVEPCGIGYATLNAVGESYRPERHSLQVIYLDATGRRKGSGRSYSFQLPWNNAGPYAHQLILTERGEYWR